jgi:hypothetical protein
LTGIVRAEYKRHREWESKKLISYENALQRVKAAAGTARERS